ncbi:UDP-glucose 4-epimerase GalE [Rhizobiaceae bacterium BDR2-2]|uniref:UDP-glucose 4-epimerase n=1 Tax=Ectorhizobium quercum TaxID=2965071 RepID=A0AAE3MW31_9HYPH|nr:UDP-glucose 4-epimerase GalE [Ectorhizobium quercum]MCX8996013.1 UDP-glucose 4-epimerase GalE [Ectorhizobium quercum]
MAVLVTGGAGYIGSHMVWTLLDAGEEVVVLDRLSTGFRWAVAPQARFYLGDVGDRALLRRIFAENAIDAILHFAGSVVVPESVAHPLRYYENNTANTRTLIGEAVAAGIGHFIFSSTAAVYGRQPVPGPVPESGIVSPETPYGFSKLMSEIMLRDTAVAYDFNYVALRYFNVAGADVQGRTGQSTKGATHLIKVACEAALGIRDHIDVYGTDYPTPDGSGVRDFIHVSDLVDAHLAALAYLRRGGAPLVANCGYGRGFSVLEVLRAVMAMEKCSFKVNLCPRRQGDLGSVIADARLIGQELGWAPKHDDLDLILRTALDWERRLSQRAATDLETIYRKLASGRFR